MDQRIKDHAEILCDWSTNIEKGDNVVIIADPEAHELIIALYEEIGNRKAYPVTIYSSKEADRAYLKSFKSGFELPEHKYSLFKEADVIIAIKSDANLMATSDIPGDTLTEKAKADKPMRDILLEKRTSLTLFPTNAHAQLAGMSLREYQKFVWKAIIRDWKEVESNQEILKQKMDEAEEVYIEGPETELTMSIKGNVGVNSAGKHNLPSGEVYTAPIPNSVEGKIMFDKPLIHSGREIVGIRLKFEEGEVVEHSAERNKELLTDLLNTDEGSKRVGELGIGTNRDIERFTKNMLFDEKMGDTIHLALGRAIERSVGEDGEGNDSALHMDIIKDMSKGRLEMDGETLMENGKFIWEM
ncbi:MAG: aminopeptidase [Thermoplasmatota archaeon]